MSQKQTEIQDEFIEKGIKYFYDNQRGYANLTMRFGKCRYAIEVLRGIAPNIYPSILLAYPDNRIKDVWIEEFNKWGYPATFTTFTNFSSLHKYKDQRFDFFLIDEFHAASDMERDYCHQIMTNDPVTKTLALSGTVSKFTQRAWGLKEIAKYSTLDGIDDEILSNYQVTVHKAKLDTTVKTPNSKGKLLTEKQKYDNYSYVIKKWQAEGKDTMHLALQRNRLSIASLGKMNCLKSLLPTLNNKRIVIFAGLTDVADRTGIPTYHNKSKNTDNFAKFQSGEINQLCLAQVGKMGVSFSKLDSVIILNATANAEDTAQIAMRCIKLDYQDKVADIHIICLDEEAELNKIQKSLSMLDKTKIKYV